jgi:Uma2 family endonuclease
MVPRRRNWWYFGPSAGFVLHDGSIRATDVSWILRISWERWEEKLRVEGKEDAFAEFVPDLVIELRSPSESISMLQSKMAVYIENGVRLGWLIK